MHQRKRNSLFSLWAMQRKQMNKRGVSSESAHTPSSLRGEAKGERGSSRSSIATRSNRKCFLSLPRKGNTPFIGNEGRQG